MQLSGIRSLHYLLKLVDIQVTIPHHNLEQWHLQSHSTDIQQFFLENSEIIQSIKIVDINGIEVFHANEVNASTFELAENFVTGIYIAYITSNKGTSIIKLVKSY